MNPASAFKVNLLEERQGAAPTDGTRRLLLQLGPHEIHTVEVELAVHDPGTRQAL